VPRYDRWHGIVRLPASGTLTGQVDLLLDGSRVAGAYRAAGDLGRAIPLYEATLADSERVLGPEHPTTSTIRSNLDEARST